MVTLFEKFKKTTTKFVKEQKKAISQQIEKNKADRLKLRKQQQSKFKLVSSLTNPQLLKVTKNFISSNPKFFFIDSQGKRKSRKPTRDEFIDSIIMKVSTANINKLLKIKTKVVKKKVDKKKTIAKKKKNGKKKTKTNDIFSLSSSDSLSF